MKSVDWKVGDVFLHTGTGELMRIISSNNNNEIFQFEVEVISGMHKGYRFDSGPKYIAYFLPFYDTKLGKKLLEKEFNCE